VDEYADVIRSYIERADGRPDVIASLAEEDIAAAVRRAQELMAPWDALDVLTWLRLGNLPMGEDYQESTHEGLLAIVELAGVILLERSGPQAVSTDIETAGTDEMPAHPGAVAQLIRDVTNELRQAIHAASVLFWARSEDWSPETFVRWRTVEREVMLRNPGYPHIQIEHLRQLFSRPVPRQLVVDSLGFDIDDALAVIDVFEMRLAETMHQGFRAAAQAIDAARMSDDPRMAQVRRQAGPRLDEMIRLYAVAVVEHQLGQRVALTVDEIASMAGRPRDAVGAVVRAFSQPFAGTDYSPVQAVVDFLGGRNPWRLRPILDAGAGRYLAVDVGLMLFGIREVVEAAIPDADRPAYARAVAAWMEDVAVEALSALLKPDDVLRNVEFLTSDGRLAELDAVLICDRVAVAVEAKHVAFSERARTGDRVRLRRDLGRLVGDTIEQAVRVRDTVLGEHQLRRRTGEPIPLPEVRRVFPVALTLEEVSSISGTVNDLITSGLVECSGTAPWVVSLHDLVVITEIVDGPAQMLAYLDQHERLVSQDILSVTEELDVFMMFLQDGLWMGDFLDENGVPTTRFMSASRTDDLDAYYLHATGQRRRAAPKPTQRWNPKGFRELLSLLETDRPPGWTTAVINLQMMDGAVRREIGSMTRRLARRARNGGRVTDETRVFEDPRFARFGITGMSGAPGWTEADVAARLRTLVTARKHVQRAASWTGLGVTCNNPLRITSLVQLDAPWSDDAELDALVTRLEMRPAAEVAVPTG
jgi:hypothetical protein